MSHATIIGGFLVLLTIAHHVAQRKREAPGKPPLVPYYLPWIGSIISIAKDPDRFFREAIMVGRNGIFGVMVGGGTRYYITDASLIREVYKNTKSFGFSPIRLEYSVAIFGMSPKAVYMPYMKDELFAFHHRLLAPTAIGALTSSYLQHTIQILSSFDPPESMSLIKLLHPQMYDSAILAFMGNTFPTTASYPLFLAFDDAFPLLAAGFMPDFVTAPGKKVREQLTDLTERWLEEHWDAGKGASDETACELVKKLVEESRAAGYTNRDLAGVLISDLWALQANSTWACFWVVALMLKQPAGLTPLYKEIDDALKTFTSAADSSGVDSVSSFISAASLPLLTSTITETLRFTTSSSSIRRVVDPENAFLAGYTLEKDDELVCVTRALHHSADIYEDPMKFKPDRFIGESREKAGKFWSPFGGGVSMCEGRHFAQQEMYIFVACLLLHFDISLGSASKPSDLDLDMSRVGLGVLHPKGDLNVLVKRQKHVI